MVLPAVVDADQTIDWKTEAASALGWWRDAGVDVLVDDLPHDWFGAASAAPVELAAAPVGFGRQGLVEPRADAIPFTLPRSLRAFAEWRTGVEAPETSWGSPLIPASGPDSSDLLILVDCPERDDRDALMGGATGRLFDRMLAAIGRSRSDVHLASVCAARPAPGRMARDIEARLADIARHHLSLAEPARLLVLGNAASRAVFSMELTDARGSLRVLNHKGGKTTAAVASFHPRFLLDRPACKGDAWKDLQMLIGHKP